MADPRVPHHLYLATFVRSMAAIPVGHGAPEIAIGVYWRGVRPVPADALDRLALLARLAADRLLTFDPPPRAAA